MGHDWPVLVIRDGLGVPRTVPLFWKGWRDYGTKEKRLQPLQIYRWEAKGSRFDPDPEKEQFCFLFFREKAGPAAPKETLPQRGGSGGLLPAGRVFRLWLLPRQGHFIDFFCAVLKGLFGYGFWLVPPALLLASYILAFHRGRRCVCA